MSLTNREIADIFETSANMLQIKGEDRFRWLSYQRAAETIRELPRSLQAIAAEGELENLPGIGKVLADKIREMLETGRLEFYDRLSEEVPPGVVEMLEINGVGSKTAATFWQELEITTIQSLKQAAEEKQLRKLNGLGAKTEEKILRGIEALEKRQTDRTPLYKAQPTAERILQTLLEMPEVTRGEIAGSIRRARPTIGDVDLLVASDDPIAVMERFATLDEVEQVLARGETKTSVVLLSGLQVDLRVLPEDRFGTALQYFTGSQHHNIRVREIALEAGYSLNENALVPVGADGELQPEKAIACATEAAVYEKIGLPWVAPEMRENNGEIEAAKRDKLPTLIKLGDIVADLHMHSTYSDGSLTVREMAEAAKARGRQYICITDHSRSLTIANGLSIERLQDQAEEVRQVNEAMGGDFTVFHGTEMDINADGSLDYPDEVLAELDFVVASLHVSLDQDQETMTERLLNAVRNPHVDLIGHPRGQLIGSRPPAAWDAERVFEAAAESGVALEINANPRRLDLEARLARRAMEMGIPIAINTDAHSAEQMDLHDYGVRTARRAWLSPEGVINTWPLGKFRAWIEARG